MTSNLITIRLRAWWAVVEAAWTILGLLLSNGNDVDWDAVELMILSA